MVDSDAGAASDGRDLACVDRVPDLLLAERGEERGLLDGMPDWCGLVWVHTGEITARFRTRPPNTQNFPEISYQGAPVALHVVMTSPALRNTRDVTDETQWERLFRIVERRRKEVLGLTQEGLHVAGAPTPRTVQDLRTRTGEPTHRMRTPLRKLDVALGWPEGTSWGLVADDRSGWSEAILRDEEEQLMEMTDEASRFAKIVEFRLRAIPSGPERDAAMRRALAALEVEP